MARKILKVFVIIVATVLILLIVLPYAFRGRIAERIKHEINEQVDARVEMGRFSLSVFRSFPDITLGIRDVSVINNAPFEGDTLAAVKRITVTIDLRSFFSGSGYEVKRIGLYSPDLKLRLLEDRSANWNIVPVTEKDPEEDSDFRLALRSIEVHNANLLYYDDVFLTYIDVVGLNGRLQGDMTMDVTSVSTRDAHIDSFSLRYSRFPIISNAEIGLKAEVGMDLANWVFDFHNNELLVNALPLSFDGRVSLPPDGGTMMDFSFAAARSDFAAFLSLIPAVYTDDFASLETSGSMALHGSVDGLLKGELIPSFDLSLEVNDGYFRYPDLPGAVSSVQVNAGISNPGNDPDLVQVEIPVLSMDLAGNPVEASFALRTPVSDPWIDMTLAGSLDLGEIKNFMPIDENIILAGLIDSQLEARGNLSSIEMERYQDFHAQGNISANNVEVSAGMLPAMLEIHEAGASFSPRYLSLNNFDMRMGESDIRANGRIDNIFSYIFEDQVLKGSFEVSSMYLNLNELIPETEATEEQQTGLSVIPVPENIDFSLDANLQMLIFGNMDISNLAGRLHIADGQLILDQLGMDMLDGRLALSGSYDTRETLPRVSFALDFLSFDFGRTFHTFNTVQALAPAGEYAEGFISGGLSMNAVLDENLMPLLESMSGRGSLSSSRLRLEGHPVLAGIAERTHLSILNGFDLRDLSLSFSFADGRVETPPFDFEFGRSLAAVSGTTWFDQRIDYVMRLDIPREQFGSGAMTVVDDLVERAAGLGINADPGERINIDVHVGGTITRPEISIGMPGAVEAVRDRLSEEAGRIIRETEDRIRDEVDRARDEAEQEVREQIEETSEQIQQELDTRAQRVIEEAERRAETVRREAANAAERIRREARQQADRLVEEASGPIAVAAARRAGEALISEAERRATQLETEANTRAGNILDEARSQADRIRRGEE